MKNIYDFIVQLYTSSFSNWQASSMAILNTNYISPVLFTDR